jgi:transglutaminase-like putative cysteine protease
MINRNRNRSLAGRTQVPAGGALLYLGLVMLSGMGLAAADWADNLALIPLGAMVGALVGMALARSRFGGRLATVFAACYGLFTTGWLLGQTLDAALPWRERILVLFGRLGFFATAVAEGRESQDALMVVLMFSLVYWAMAVYGAWSLFRRRSILGGILPLGLALLLNAYYYLGEVRLDILVGVYVLFGLLLFLDLEIRARQEEWSAIRARVPGNAVAYLARAGAIAVVVLIIVGWVGPAFAGSARAADAWSAVSAPWRAMRERIGKALAGLRSPVALVGEKFGDALVLEGGIELSDDLIMEVAPADGLRASGRFYWRARTYSTYQDGRWSASVLGRQPFDPGQGPLPLADNLGREEIQVTIAFNNSVQQLLYLPAQPIWVNRTSELVGVSVNGELVDVSAVLADQPIFRGEALRAVGSVAVPTADELRSAGTDYPDWVIDRYLQLPASITERTRELSRRIAADLPTAFDQAAAITGWLRRNIEYQRVTEAPPSDQEPVDWIIFDYGVGYCNFYATTEVVMLRSLGVPARLAVGYARGEFAADQGLYRVAASDFHAWPEVYFPGYGWVEFEPTVSQPALTRPEVGPTSDELEAAQRLGFGSRGELDDLRLERMEDLLTAEEPLPSDFAAPEGPLLTARLVWILLFLLIGSVALWILLDPAWRLRLAAVGGWRRMGSPSGRGLEAAERRPSLVSASSRAYYLWMAWWPRLGLTPHSGQTPNERAASFASAYPHLADTSLRLADLYGAERFGGRVASPSDIGALWRELSPQLVRAWLTGLRQRLITVLQAPSDTAESTPDLPDV